MATSAATSPPPVPGLRLKLSVMMFIQLFIWGAWYELGFDYIPKLGYNGFQLGLIFGAFNLGALMALFFSTQFADRKFAAEKFLAFSHLVGGLAILGLFFLPGKLGTQPGEYLSAVTVTKGPDGRGLGSLTVPGTPVLGPNGRDFLPAPTLVVPVVVDGITWPEKEEGDDKPQTATVTAVVTGAVPALVPGSPVALTARKEPIAPFWPFFGLMLLHSLLYVPTISIVNSIAFANLRDPTNQFGPVRVWGTIGWIAASWPFIFILVDWAKVPAMGDVGFVDWFGKAVGDKETSVTGAAALNLKRYIFLVAGVSSLVMAGYSLLLPHTPPRPAAGGDSLAWLKAMKLLRLPFVMVLFVVTFIDAAVHQSFFYWTFTFLGPVADGGVVGIPANWVGPVMKIGQIAEILTMLVLGYVLKRFGWRLTMTLGVLGHAARFAVFAYYPHQEAAILINVLHGVCYAFFFATVYIFVDEYFPKDVRSSAQGLFNVLIIGVGPFVANFVCGQLKGAYPLAHVVDGKEVETVNFSMVYQYSMAAALTGSVILFLFFHPRKAVEEPTFSHVEADSPPVA